MSTVTRIVAVTCIGLMAGCAGGPFANSPAPTKDTYLKYAGPPIDSFTYLGRDIGFRTLGGQDLVIWTTVNDAYLIKVLEPCVDLPFANKVQLTSASKTVTRSFDWVIVNREGSSTLSRCHIDTIRHVDYGAMKQAHLAPP